ALRRGQAHRVPPVRGLSGGLRRRSQNPDEGLRPLRPGHEGPVPARLPGRDPLLPGSAPQQPLTPTVFPGPADGGVLLTRGAAFGYHVPLLQGLKAMAVRLKTPDEIAKM